MLVFCFLWCGFAFRDYDDLKIQSATFNPWLYNSPVEKKHNAVLHQY